ncbi:MAG TPA: RNA polymerase sigma factor [Terriglobales bacterium]|nr:RNA polymerase sigma factor [Terriglobales bacterium]
MGSALAVSADEAFGRRIDAYLAPALGLAYHVLGDQLEAEEATQEAMARAWKARRSLRQIDSFEAWVDRIVVNTCRERLRRRRRVREVQLTEVQAESSDSFAALLTRDSIGRALAALTAEQRTVVVLRYWRDLSLEQMAERLTWPLGTVKSRLHNAHSALREQLRRDDSEVQR